MHHLKRSSIGRTFRSPFYPRIVSAALHGSCTRDLDVVLVAWTDIAEENHEKIVKQVASSTNTTISGSFSEKPHGRKAYTLLFKEFGDPRWIDLSIITPRKYND